jgi:hypothetical protein
MGCPEVKTENWRFVSAETAGYAYSPYGTLAKSFGSDSGTGLVCYNYRYYSPELGRCPGLTPSIVRGCMSRISRILQHRPFSLIWLWQKMMCRGIIHFL